MSKWDEMTERERDAWIDEHVMEWGGTWGDPTQRKPKFTTEASDDYIVLCKVRESWGPAKASVFMDELVGNIWAPRRAKMYRGLCYADALMYQPGDYSHAVFLALEENR